MKLNELERQKKRKKEGRTPSCMHSAQSYILTVSRLKRGQF